MRLPIMTLLIVIATTGFATDGIIDAYQHGHEIKGQLIITDLNSPECHLKSPYDELIVYLEEKSDFLIPRGVRSSLNEKGEFYFPVDSRYVNYRLVVLVTPSNFLTYQTTLYAYNAPETYKLTLSCVDDMTMWNSQ